MTKGVKIGIGCLVVLIVVAIIIVMSVMGVYNRLVQADETVNNAWAQVENQLQRRYDLIPNLVETVKGYAAHENEVLTQVTRARASVGSAKTPDEKMSSNNDLSNALARLMVVVESYPNLKANENFIRLQDELAGTENRIAVERKRYNDTVTTFNQQIRQFPTNILAGMFNLGQRTYFKAPEDAKQAPKVDFSK
jgi:LemA protein